MRHQNITVGMQLAFTTDAKARYGSHTLPGIAVVKRLYTNEGYKEPWIELQGFHGQFRAKDFKPVKLASCICYHGDHPTSGCPRHG